MIYFALDIVLYFSAFLIDVNYMSDIFIFCAGFCMIFARFLAELNFVVITTNYIVVQSSDAYPPPGRNSAKDNTFMLFLRCFVSSFQTQNPQNIVSSYSFVYYIWGAYLRLVSFLCYTRQGYVLHFHPNHHFSFPNYLFYLEIDLETVFEKPINHATFRPKNPSQKSPRNCRFYHFRHRNPAPLQHFSSIVPFSIQYRIPTLFLL